MNDAFFPTPEIPAPKEPPEGSSTAETSAATSEGPHAPQASQPTPEAAPVQESAPADASGPSFFSDTYILTASECTDPQSPDRGMPKIPAQASDVHATFSKLGLSMVVLLAAMLAGTYAIDYLLAVNVPGYGLSWWRTWVLSLLPLYGLGLPLMYLVLRKIPVAPHNTDYPLGRNRDLMQKPRFTVGNFITLLFLAFGCMYVGSIIGNAIMSILSTVMEYPYANGLQSMVDESPFWMTFIGTCICAPLGEEFIFRKLLIDRSRRFGDGVSIIVSGFFFGLFHGNLFQFFYAFMLGLVLAYIYTRTGNLWWCVAMHAIVNFMGGIVVPGLAALLPENTLSVTPMQSLVSLLIMAWTYGTIIAAIVILVKHRDSRKISSGQNPLYAEKSAFRVMLNPGMLTNYILMSIMMVLSLIPAY